MTFSKNYVATIWWHVTDHVTWSFHGNHILKACFLKFPFPLILKLNKSFLVTFVTSLDHFMVFLFVLITFELIKIAFFLGGGGGLDKSRNPFRKDYAIITPCVVITSWCRRQRRHFQTYYLPSKSRCHGFYIVRVTRGGGGEGRGRIHLSPRRS